MKYLIYYLINTLFNYLISISTSNRSLQSKVMLIDSLITFRVLEVFEKVNS